MMPTPLIRKKVIDQVGFFNEIMPPAGEDVEYFTRCSFVSKIFYLDEPLALYRRHSNNISGNSIKYLELPLYLKNVLLEELERERITKKQNFFLLNSLCKMQIKMAKYGFIYSIRNLFLLDFYWILRKNNFKMLICIFFFK